MIVAILVVMGWMNGYVAGPIVTTVEFTSMERCEAAARNLSAEAKGWHVGDSIHAFCVLK